MIGIPLSAQVREAWEAYAGTNGAMRAAAGRLSLLPATAVAKAAGDRYRTVMRYLLGHAPPLVRAWFLESLLDDTLRDNDYTDYAVTAIGTVDGSLVRAALPDYAWKVLHADPEGTDPTALHVLWLYGQFAVLRLILNSWQSRRDQEDIDDFEASHPMPDAPGHDQPGQHAAWSLDDAKPGRLLPVTRVIVRAAQVAEAARAWDEFGSALALSQDAIGTVRAVGPRLVLDHAVAVGAALVDTSRLLARWCQKDGFAAAVAVLGAQFFETHFEPLLELAAVSAFVAAPLLRSLRQAAVAAGRQDLVTRVDQVEHATYGEFGESGYYIVKVRD